MDVVGCVEKTTLDRTTISPTPLRYSEEITETKEEKGEEKMKYKGFFGNIVGFFVGIYGLILCVVGVMLLHLVLIVFVLLPSDEVSFFQRVRRFLSDFNTFVVDLFTVEDITKKRKGKRGRK